MALNLLIDLDGTLLENEVTGFVAKYSEALSNFLSDSVEPVILKRALFAATAYMVRNQKPDQTLEATFDSAFYPAIGHAKPALVDKLHDFYRDIFPTLRSLTKMKPEAVDFIQDASGRGHHLVVATNPLFPHTAIQQRLEWAGFPIDQNPFLLVPSFETFHFSKPEPAYFAELLARLGWPDGPVVMVGNDLNADIYPASTIGICTFWIRDGQSELAASAGSGYTACGSISDVLPWLEQQSPESLLANFNSPAAYIAILKSTAAAWDHLSRQLPSNAWIQRPKADEWSLAEIICHLRDVEAEVNLPRLRTILAENNPFVAGQDTDPWAHERQYIIQDCVEARQAFISARMELLSIIDTLTAQDWLRPARHAIFGPTDLREIVSIITGHDRLHIQQVHQTLEQIQ